MEPASEPHRRREFALGLPQGSVRALLALMITAGIWTWLLLRPEATIPSYLRDLMFIIMGHYFAARSRDEPAGGPAPLYLPRGSVRAILLAGFMGVGALLFHQQRLGSIGNPNHAAVTLILVAGFLLGVLAQTFAPRRLPRLIEDARAVISLSAGALLLMLVFGVMAMPQGRLEVFLLRHSIEEVLAAVVGFYFGSRS